MAEKLTTAAENLEQARNAPKVEPSSARDCASDGGSRGGADNQSRELTTREDLFLHASHDAQRSRSRWRMAAVVGGAIALGAIVSEKGCNSLPSSHHSDAARNLHEYSRREQVKSSYLLTKSLMSQEIKFSEQDLLLIRGFFADKGRSLAEMLFESAYPNEHYRDYKGFSISPSPGGEFITISLEIEYGRLSSRTVTFTFDLIKKSKWNASVANVAVHADGMEQSYAAERAASAALGKVFTIPLSENSDE